MDRRIFFGLPVKLGQLCSHSGSLGGSCALLALCLGKEKASPLWIPHAALGRRPHPCWTFGCLFQLTVNTSKGYLNCGYGLSLRETQKCSLQEYCHSIIFLGVGVFWLIVFSKNLLYFSLLGADGSGCGKWIWDQSLLPFTQNPNVCPLPLMSPAGLGMQVGTKQMSSWESKFHFVNLLSERNLALWRCRAPGLWFKEKNRNSSGMW